MKLPIRLRRIFETFELSLPLGAHLSVRMVDALEPIAIDPTLSEKGVREAPPVVASLSARTRGLGRRREGIAGVTTRPLWRGQVLPQVSVEVGGPFVALTAAGIRAAVLSVTAGSSMRSGATQAVQTHVTVPIGAATLTRLLATLARKGPVRRWLWRAMPVVGLGIQLRFLLRSLDAALESEGTKGQTLAWARVAADVAAIPMPMLGLLAETVLGAFEGGTPEAPDGPSDPTGPVPD